MKEEFMVSPAALQAFLNGDLGSFVSAASPGGIEAQEKAGQTSFVNSTTLPKEMLGCTQEQLEKMGIKFGDDVDDIFVTAYLPDGWKKQATDHSMWSDLLDDKGRVRASIFYKAAFYDRSAHISLNRYYYIDDYIWCDANGADVADREKQTHMKTAIMNYDKEVIHIVGVREKCDYDEQDNHVRTACEWIETNYPDWHNPLAYWD